MRILPLIATGIRTIRHRRPTSRVLSICPRVYPPMIRQLILADWDILLPHTRQMSILSRPYLLQFVVLLLHA